MHLVHPLASHSTLHPSLSCRRGGNDNRDNGKVKERAHGRDGGGTSPFGTDPGAGMVSDSQRVRRYRPALRGVLAVAVGSGWRTEGEMDGAGKGTEVGLHRNGKEMKGGRQGRREGEHPPDDS